MSHRIVLSLADLHFDDEQDHNDPWLREPSPIKPIEHKPIFSDENFMIDSSAKVFLEDGYGSRRDDLYFLCYVICDGYIYEVYGDVDNYGIGGNALLSKKIDNKYPSNTQVFSDIRHGLHCLVFNNQFNFYDAINDKRFSKQIDFVPHNVYFVTDEFWIGAFFNYGNKLAVIIAINSEYSNQFSVYFKVSDNRGFSTNTRIVSHVLFNHNLLALFYTRDGELKCLLIDRILGGIDNVLIGVPTRENLNYFMGQYSGRISYTSLFIEDGEGAVKEVEKKIDLVMDYDTVNN